MINISRDGYLYVTALTVQFGGFIASFCMNWASPMIPKLTKLDDNPLGRIATSSEQSLLVALPSIGCLIGCFVIGHLAKVYGRKLAIIVTTIPCVIAYPLMLISTNIWDFYILRAMTGVSLGGTMTVNVMYVAECAEKSNRGLLGTISMILMNTGSLCVLVLSSMVSFFWLHVFFSLCSILHLILVPMLVVESPVYLLQKNSSEAERILKKLRGRSDVTEELNDMKRSLEKLQQNKTNVVEMFQNPGLRKAFAMVCSVICFQTAVGFVVVVSFAQSIFEEAGDFIPEALGPVILNIVTFLASFITPFVIDRFGRKLILTTSHIGIAISVIPLGIYFILQEHGRNLDAINWLPLLSLILFVGIYSFGMNTAPIIILSEIFPMEVKELSISMCVLLLTLSNFVMLYTFLPLKDILGSGPLFCLFGLFSILGALYGKFYLIETKGKSLTEIQNIFNP